MAGSQMCLAEIAGDAGCICPVLLLTRYFQRSPHRPDSFVEMALTPQVVPHLIQDIAGIVNGGDWCIPDCFEESRECR